MDSLQAKDNLEDTSKFFANTVHEIRTPVQTILGTLDLLAETNLDKEQKEYVHQLQFGADVLLHLANDILDFSKIQSGHLQIEHIPFNSINTVEQVTDLICFEAHNKGLEVVTDIDYSIPPMIMGDPVRLQQVLLNLLKNAVKFTSKGYLRLKVAQRKNASVLLFEIADSGIGISEEAKKHLFSDYYQASSSTSRKYGGTGLGLSIAKNLVSLMGGKIGVENNPSGGAIFWFTIPLVPDLESLSVPEEFPQLSENTSILIVDDQIISLRSLKSKLILLGAKNVEMVTSGKMALQKMREAATAKKPYTLALIDMIMPVMDGWRLSAEINADKSINETKLYLMIPEGQMGGEAKMKMLDWFNGYLYKPIKYKNLAEVLAEPQDTPLDLEVIQIDREPVEFNTMSNISILVAEDHPINRKILTTFLLQNNSTVYTAENGEEAVKTCLKHPEISLIFMDIQMPIMSGVQATAEIRRAGYRGIIIACTANTNQEDFELYLKNGMNDVLVKPFKKNNVWELLKKWAPVLSYEDTPPSSTNSKEVKTKKDKILEAAGIETQGIWDIEDFFDTVNKDKALAKQLMYQYIEQTKGFLFSGRESIQLKNFQNLSRIGHTLKGSSAALSITELTKIAELLEQAANKENEKDCLDYLNNFSVTFTKFIQMGEYIDAL